MRVPWLAVVACAWALTSGAACPASLGLCDRAPTLSAQQQDRLLRFAAIARRELEDSGQAVAVVSRSGLDLQRFGVRYSHAGVALKSGGEVTWSVRQLYFACDAGRPRLYDQGLAGFVYGTDDAAQGQLSILLLPPDEAAGLQRAALDRPRALRLVAQRYSANAHPFSLRYQNCNQWLIELMAMAWGATDAAPDDGEDLRSHAQQWLAAQGYAPRPIELGSHLMMFAAGFIPWLHLDDHPPEDLWALRIRTSLPASIEDFVRTRVPGAQRIELCHDDRQVVVRRSWEPIAEGCRPAAGDRVIPWES